VTAVPSGQSKGVTTLPIGRESKKDFHSNQFTEEKPYRLLFTFDLPSAGCVPNPRPDKK